MAKIMVRAIMEVMGFPEEHVKEVMKQVIDKIKAEQKVLKVQEFDVKQIKEFWSTYSEFEMSFADVREVMQFCFRYTPSSIEIVYPEHFDVDSMEINALLNDVLAKVHDNDMIVKNAIVQIRALRSKLGLKEGESVDDLK